MQINILLDSSINSAPDASELKTAIGDAVNELEGLFLDPIQITLVFDWGNVDGQSIPSGDLAASIRTGGVYTNYSQLKSYLTNDATTPLDTTALSTLTSDPTHGGTFFLPYAQAKALGDPQVPQGGAEIDGYVGLGSSVQWTFEPGNSGAGDTGNPLDRAQPGSYDVIGTLEHEITEVMGRVGSLATYDVDGGPGTYTALDLFRYQTVNGNTVRDLTPGPNASISLDGQHLTLPLEDPTKGQDVADWATFGDSFGFGSMDKYMALSPTDIQLMDAIGYDSAEIFVAPGQTISNYAVTPNHFLEVEAFATTSRSILDSGATEVIQASGNSISASIAGGIEDVLAGGTAIGATITNGGAQYVYGVASGTSVSGGTLESIQQVVAGGFVSGTTVSNGGVQIDAGSAFGTNVRSGGTLSVDSGGVANSIQLNGGSVGVYVGGVAVGTIINSGGHLDANGGLISATTINGGGSETVEFDGASTTVTTINNGGSMTVFGVASATTELWSTMAP
jgi:autotransporter passenger strand-loop-strand repeat protein